MTRQVSVSLLSLLLLLLGVLCPPPVANAVSDNPNLANCENFCFKELVESSKVRRTPSALLV